MGLKERFADRQPPRATVPMRMDFSADADGVLRDLEAAELALEAARARGLPDLGALERRVETAQSKAAGLYEQLVVCALPPQRFDKLVEEHPPSAEQKEKAADAQWDPVTFGPALLAACVESNMSESDWADLISGGPVSGGEVRLLLNTALDINDRSPDPGLGKL